jgi:hypothetical protein
MTRTTAIFLICAALASGCHRSQTARRSAENYQVVEEGQASGVTSTINAPGETPPPLTDTAIDTTTNFTLPDNPAPLGTQPPNTVAGTLPTYTAYPPTPAPRPRPVTPPPPMSSGTSAPPPQPQAPQPPPTDTAVTDEVLPPATDTEKTDTTKTDTTSTTTTTTPPSPTPPV